VLSRPAEALQRAPVVITMLSDDAAVKAVTLGPDGVTSGASGGTLIEMSTISPRSSSEIANACREAGIAYLRAPVSGNPAVVAAGNLGIIVSGPESEFQRLSGVLGEIGPNLFYVGADEQARVVKLALNLMLGGTTQLLAEALVLTQKYGLDRAKMLEVIAGSAIGSPYVRYKTQPLIDEDFSSTFTARLLHKDLTMALDAAHEVSVPLTLTAATQQLVEGCIDAGMGDLDLSALVPRLEREAQA
jgi:3-hydroxyisobutyrate dehydrogenase-like beta-hydroxyacid dehydrogenase